ncbi:MAG TPA: hypothetical protein VNT26_02900 [Candidatus Sulfotelmatobacter sp.]|nr:hypothetical protein [Candidatus Sulfotelmatobacter sp.]
MIELLKIKTLKRRRLTSLLGLTLDGSRLEGIVLRRTNGSLQLQQAFSVGLSLDPLTADAELVGREIRNHLDAAGVRERHCVLGLPLKWLLTTHVEIPDLPEADVASFLQLEAERGFPCDIATLQVCSSRCQLPGGKGYAMLVGVPRNHLVVLEQVLRVAKLKPVSFSLGITALEAGPAPKADGVLALAVGESQVGLQVTGGGGVAALRALEGALELAGSRRVLQAELVAREARITLGQLPAALRESVRLIRIFGPRDLAQQLADEMELRLEPLGLKVEVVTRYDAPAQLGVQLPQDAPVSAALSLAARHLVGRATAFELLPPRVTAWQQMAARYSSGKLRLAGAGAAAVLLLLFGVFGFQQWQLWRLQAQWTSLAPKVHELEAIQQNLRQYRPWYDESLRGLSLLRQLTEAFPEDGVVSAKTIEVRELATVTCTGLTRDNTALLKTLERLRGAGGIADLKVSQIRGKSPMQFTFDYHWSEGGKSER